MKTESDGILVGREMQWEEIQKFSKRTKRKVCSEQLAKDLDKLEDEA